MNLPALTTLARSTACFTKYQDGKLWYEIEWRDPSANRDTGEDVYRTFEFPIPVDDAGGGVFLPSDKGLVFLRWIRPHLEFLRASLEGDVQ